MTLQSSAFLGNQQMRLRWHCRRGLRELDILLEKFLQNRYPYSTQQEQKVFEALLSHKDHILLAWFTQNAYPPKYALLVRAILNAYPQSDFDCYLGLGSNMQNPKGQLQKALQKISDIPHTRCLAISAVYKSLPVGNTHQPHFLNAVVYLKTKFSAHALLEILQDIETAQGRIRSGRKNEPRTLDLDILLYDNQSTQTEKLVLPHPGLYQRAFVLKPLCDIAPNLKLPNGKTAREALSALGDISHLCEPI